MNQESANDVEQGYDYIFTVFTPAYNSAHTLHRVYESLKVQTYRDFEWLIVDDGSTDNTRQLVEQWQKEAEFPIRYVYQKNKGKHFAINRGVREAKGELFLTLDADDACVPKALERLKFHWDTIPENEKAHFSAVTCLCQNQKGELIGSRFPFVITDSAPLEMRYRFKVTGEKWGFQRTDVMKEFPFPEEFKQTCIPEGLVWKKIDNKYKIRYVNEVLRIYNTGHVSQSNPQNPSRNAIGGRLEKLSVLNEEISFVLQCPLEFVRSAVHYSRFSFHVGKSVSEQGKALDTALGKLLWVTALPVGYLVYIKDKNKG